MNEQISTSFPPRTVVQADTPIILQRLLDAARECVIVVDRNMRISHCNIPAAVTFARAGLELENRRLSEVIRDLDLHEAFRKAITTQISSDIRLELAAMEKRNFDIHIAPIDINGQACAIGFFYETTQIDRLETIRQEFLSNISHELRTPLTSILAFVETLENGGIEDRENCTRFLSVIRRNAERMRSLISDISELSMIESGNVTMDIREVKLAIEAQDVMNSLTNKAAERGVELKNEVSPDVSVFADPIRLEQMLVNLIDNAIKFNREGGTVTVSHRIENGRDIISVSDTGEGVLPEHAQRIFERFYRADRARTSDVGGTGLGLSIVKHLARLHGGEVTLASKLGHGSTFSIELPA
jgi:two-component system phosphate regulon sensor histidine kinase PhoR